METGWQAIDQIVQRFSPQLFFDFLQGYKSVVLLMVLGYGLHFLPVKLETEMQNRVIRFPLAAKAALVVAVILIVVQIKSAGIQPFIYFQF